MKKFGNTVDQYVRLLNTDLCEVYDAYESFAIMEKKETGYAKVSLSSQYPCLHIRNLEKKTFGLLRNQRCADHAILVFDTTVSKWGLFLFEMTKTVSSKTWTEKIVQQFEGGLLNAYAIAGILHIHEFCSITAYCCYRINKDLQSPYEYKTELGKSAKRDWTEGERFSVEAFPNVLIYKRLLELDKESGEAVIGKLLLPKSL